MNKNKTLLAQQSPEGSDSTRRQASEIIPMVRKSRQEIKKEHEETKQILERADYVVASTNGMIQSRSLISYNNFNK